MISQREPAESVPERELVEKWRTLVFEPAAAEVEALLAAFPDRRGLRVPFEACGTDYRFTAPLFDDPDRVLAAGRRALREFVDDRFGGGIGPDDRVYLRLTDVPDGVRLPLAAIHAEHLNRLVAVGGTVERVDHPQPRVLTARFECERCGKDTTIPQRDRQLRRSAWCSHCSTSGTLRLASNRCTYVDAQTLALGDGDRQLRLSLEHDLAGRFAVGDRIDVVAIPRARVDDGTTVADVELEAISADPQSAADGRGDPDRSHGDPDRTGTDRDGPET